MLELRASLVADLKEQHGQVHPFRFEQIVLDLLLAMGYGGSRKEAAMVTQKTGDEGIDGVINEDRLGLNVIYIQAKRWKTGKVAPRTYRTLWAHWRSKKRIREYSLPLAISSKMLATTRLMFSTKLS